MTRNNLRRRQLRTTRGIGVVEVIVIVALVGFLIICLLISLPRGRETSRMAICQRNLMQIGVGLQLYEQANRRYPSGSPLANPPNGDSTISAMLHGLVLPDFLDLHDPTQPPKPLKPPIKGMRVPGLTCPSDTQVTAGTFLTGVSYRANVGDDTVGSNGPMAPGSLVSSQMVEEADGLSFTAGFAERLLGTGRDGDPGPMNYVEVPGPVTIRGGVDERSAWRGDAGSSWTEPGWRSAIYSHSTPPDGSTSCVASDGRSATLTASSSHLGRINVGMLDGSLRGVAPTIDPKVWRAMGSIRSSLNLTEPVKGQP